MTIDLKWLLPFTAPFIVTLLFRLLVLVTGASYNPDLALVFSTSVGLMLGFLITMFVIEVGPLYPIRIGKKEKQND